MTTTFDTETYDLAGELLEEFGTTATLTTSAGKTKTVGTSTVSGFGTDHTIRVSPPAPFDTRLVDGETVKAADLKVTLGRKNGESIAGAWADLTIVPAEGDRVALGSDDYSVVGIMPLRSGDDIAAWILHLRAD